MQWFWINMPLAAIFFAVWTGVPLWLVLKHPDTGPEPRVLAPLDQVPGAGRAQPQAADAYSSEHENGNELVGARR